jgi:SAM-dependent methyltransferase
VTAGDPRSEPPAWASHPDLVTFFAGNRNRVEDLYPSERRFLGWLAAEAGDVLDVGCAAGGFLDVWRAFKPAVRYTGVDLSQELVAAAHRLHPGAEFLVADCADSLPFADRSATVVQALGWLHWEPRYEAAVDELWRVARRFLFFDVRLQNESPDEVVGAQRLDYGGAGREQAVTPYIAVSWPRFAARLLALGPARVLGYGYYGPPSSSVSGAPESVCFASFVLERDEPPGGRPEVCLELPLAWPEDLRPSVSLYPDGCLRGLVPEVEPISTMGGTET